MRESSESSKFSESSESSESSKSSASVGAFWSYSSRCTFKHRESEILAFLVNFGYFVAKVCTLRCTFTGLNDAVVYQYGQI